MRRTLLAIIVCCMASGAGRLTVASADESKPNSGKEEPQADERSKPPAGSSKSAKPKSRQKKVDPRPQTKKPANKDSNAAPTDLAVAGMKKIVVEVDIKDMSLEELAEWINRDTGANVIVRWKLLEKEGITRASKISVKARNINIRQLLALSFLHLTQSKPSVELSAQARGNTIIISTRKDHNSKMITRVYEVADLIQDMPDFPIAGSERGFSRSSKRRADKRLMHAGRGQEIDPHILDLIDSITMNIEPHSWKVAGGKGRIRYYRGKLIIYNSVEVHQLIGGPVTSRE